jgi:hypothetical protein
LRGTVCAAALATAVAAASLVATSLPAAAAHDGPRDKHKPKHKETAHVSKDPFDSMPKGPLQIIISIDQQRLHLYSSGAHVTDALIASGMPGHATPMGVFSVIEKDRYHQSNIYSGAPMPFMQRITWSGVAMHEGVGLGHPASHGCIRLPHEFAARLFTLRSIGARVIIARPELKLADIADPHLFVHKTAPPPAPSAAAPAAMEPIKTAQSIDSSKTTDAVASDASAGPVDGTRAFVSVKDQVAPAAAARTDNAEGKASRQPDAPKAGDARATAPQPIEDAAAHKPATVSDTAAQAPAETAPADTTATTTVTAPKPNPKVDSNADLRLEAAPAPGETGKPATPAIDVASPTPADATPATAPVPAPKPAVIAKPAKHDPIAIFVSRRTKKIYVRQDFAPLFDAAVTIAHPDEPLGTHVFTAMGYLDGGTTFRWNVISLPGDEPKAPRTAEKDGKGKKHEAAKANPNKPNPDPQPPQTPQQALARIEIPQSVIDQISELMMPGSSLVISDQGLGEETGEGTDFIVVTR